MYEEHNWYAKFDNVCCFQLGFPVGTVMSWPLIRCAHIIEFLNLYAVNTVCGVVWTLWLVTIHLIYSEWFFEGDCWFTTHLWWTIDIWCIFLQFCPTKRSINKAGAWYDWRKRMSDGKSIKFNSTSYINRVQTTEIEWMSDKHDAISWKKVE